MVERPKILSISAHAADFCSRSGGTLARYAGAGSEVAVICLTYGARGESDAIWQKRPEIELEEVKRIRRGEAERAAAILGVARIRFLDWDDHPLLASEERLLQLIDEMRGIGPDIVLTHWTPDPSYPDHSLAGRLATEACQQVSVPGLKTAHPPIPAPQVFFYEATYPYAEFTAFRPDTYIDITEVYDRKMRALKELAATQGVLPDFYAECATKRGREARGFSGKQGIIYAEGFVRMYPWAGEFFPL